MKTDHEKAAASIRAAALLLAGLLFAAGMPAAGEVKVRVGPATISFATPSDRLAKELAQGVKEVQQRFDVNRRALPLVQGPGGEPAYPLQEVAGLIDRTQRDLDQAIERLGKPELEALRAWSAAELELVRGKLAAPAAGIAAMPRGLSMPRAVAVVAGLGSLRLPGLAALSAAAPQQATITAGRANGLLDQVGQVVGRIFFLAENNDLEVKLWVGSTPAQPARFRFWPRGKVKGTAPAPAIVRTNGRRDHVVRGLYNYSAAWSKGAVTELIEYPSSASAPSVRQESEQLDLVSGSGFFCCRFNEQYCHHVANEKDCR